MRRPHCCHISLGFVLKFLNFLQAFVGVSIVVYSAWMINQWNHQIPLPPPHPLAPSPAPASLSIPFNSPSSWLHARISPLNLAIDTFSAFDDGLGFDFKLPAPWFIYAFMGVGIFLCCITFIGCIAAEAINGCCLCFYTILITVLILLEAALVGFIAVDHQWAKDLPFDPTGELDSLRSFILHNLDICKWLGIAVLVVQALSLLLALILRATVSTQKGDFDDEDEYEVSSRRTWDQSSQPSGSTKGDNRADLSDIWSSRIREKYGLKSSDKHSLPIQNPPPRMNSGQ